MNLLLVPVFAVFGVMADSEPRISCNDSRSTIEEVIFNYGCDDGISTQLVEPCGNNDEGTIRATCEYDSFGYSSTSHIRCRCD